jgi:hypothetical protein
MLILMVIPQRTSPYAHVISEIITSRNYGGGRCPGRATSAVGRRVAGLVGAGDSVGQCAAVRNRRGGAGGWAGEEAVTDMGDDRDGG